MNVRMIQTYMRGLPDGITIRRFLAGQKYDLPETEATLLMRIGVAIEDKDLGQAPETKAAPAAPSATPSRGKKKKKGKTHWVTDAEYPFQTLEEERT
jgi:hypothetical protein